MCVFKNRKFFKQSSRFLENSLFPVLFKLSYLNKALIQIVLINTIINHIDEATTLTIHFQLVITLFNFIFEISIHPLKNNRKTNPHLTTAFHFWNGFRYNGFVKSFCVVLPVFYSLVACFCDDNKE